MNLVSLLLSRAVLCAAALLLGALQARAAEVVDARFVEPGGRPGHTGLFPLQGQPAVGKTQTLRVVVSGVAGPTVTVSLVSATGSTLSTSTFTRVEDPDFESKVFYGSFTIPAVPFRISVAGMGKDSKPFQLNPSSQILPSTLDIKIRPLHPSIARGVRNVFYLFVTNLGPPGTFNVSITDNVGNSANPYAPTMQLGTGQQSSIRINADLPVQVSALLYKMKASLTNGNQQSNAQITVPLATGTVRTATVDVLPQSCTNPLARNSGLTPIVILSTSVLSVANIDFSTLSIAGVVAPARYSIEDVGGPNQPCHKLRKDGISDAVLLVDSSALRDAVNGLFGGQVQESMTVSVPVHLRDKNGIEYVGYDNVTLIGN